MSGLRSAVKKQTTGRHVGYGKVILFGEHVVVHGATAIVAGVSEFTACRLELSPSQPGFRVVDKRPAVPGYIAEKAEEQRKAHQLVLDHNKIDLTRDGLTIHLGGPLVPSSGIGASASDVVSLSRALSEMYGLSLSEDEVNHSAFVGEGGYHGTPSGVDNTAATFGGLLTYKRVGGKSSFAPVAFRTPLFLVVVGTGITASTTKVVGDVRALKEKDPKWFSGLMQRYDAIAAAAIQAIEQGDITTLGALMDANHTLCQEMTISCPELEAIVTSARKNGAIGAKLSGTGRGGIAVALARNKADQERIGRALKDSCPAARFVWLYSVAPPQASGARSKL
jgi:mevalonate kinase